MQEHTKSKTYEIKEKIIDRLQIYQFIDHVNKDGVNRQLAHETVKNNHFQENLLLSYYSRVLWQ